MNAKLEIVAIEQPEIIEAFKVEGGTRALFERVSENARSVVFDMGVKKDRESLKSFAYSLARIKTTVDNHGKELVSGIKQQAAVIDADRKFWRDNMELLQDEIRKPLTDFEQAEKKVAELLAEGRNQVAEMVTNAEKRAAQIVEEAKSQASHEAARITAQAKADVDQEANRAREALREQVAALAVKGAESILRREVDVQQHAQILSTLKQEL